MNAKNREEFRRAWNSHFEHAVCLRYSLEDPVSKEQVLQLIKEFKELVEEATYQTFGRDESCPECKSDHSLNLLADGKTVTCTNCGKHFNGEEDYE